MKLTARKIVFIAFIISVVTASSLSVFLHTHGLSKTKTRTLDISAKLEVHSQKEPGKTSYNVLLLGFGGADHSGGGLSDALMLLHTDLSRKKVTFVAIPRDIWIPLPVRSDIKEYHKINAAFAVGNDDKTYPLKEPIYTGKDGGGAMAKYAAGLVTGLAIDHYVAVDFSRFERMIDVLGGISVDVPVSFVEEFYPIKGLENETCGFSPEEMNTHKAQFSGFELEKIYKCRYERLEFRKGQTQMDGATALKFTRSRHSPEHGGDFARGVRQQAVLLAIKDKLLSIGELGKILEFYEKFSGLTQTDIGEENILEVLSKVGDPKDYTAKSLNITTDNFLQNSVSTDGQYILIPKAGADNWAEVHNYLRDELTSR